MTRKRYINFVLSALAVALILSPTEATMSEPARPVAHKAQAVECPACHQNVAMVAVGGHIQCPNCRTVVESCCEGPIPSFVQAHPTTLSFPTSRR